jgi:hypothetical protein
MYMIAPLDGSVSCSDIVSRALVIGGYTDPELSPRRFSSPRPLVPAPCLRGCRGAQGLFNPIEMAATMHCASQKVSLPTSLDMRHHLY